jgi:alpha-tubulin suppressor-like RCC1 family protein
MVLGLALCGCGRTELFSFVGRADGGAGRDAAPGEIRGIALTASTNDAASVHLTWKVLGDGAPAGFVLRRDGRDLATLGPTARTFDDSTAEAGTFSAPASLTATRGTRTDGVELVWTAAAAAAGAAHVYQIAALDGAATVESNPATGQRAAPAMIEYELSRDGGPWQSVGPGPSTLDVDAPLGSITASAFAAAAFPGNVRLGIAAEPTVTPPAPSTYSVRAVSRDGPPAPASPAAMGYRGVGDVVAYQWQRSAADSDASYANLPGVTGALWFDVQLAPGTARYYRATLSADGAAGVTAGVRAAAPGFKAVAAGDGHACGLLTSGQMMCWGVSASGAAPPGPTSDLFTSIAAGGDHTCGVRVADGKLVCWGDNTYGSAPPGPSDDTFVSVASSSFETCAVRTDGRIVCFGNFASGVGSMIPWDDTFTQVSTERNHTCGLRTDGAVLCFGDNSLGQAPPGPSVDRFAGVTVGSGFTCAIRAADARVVCWGRNRFANAAPPGPSPDSFQAISADETNEQPFVCGLRTDGTLRCWGDDTFGESQPDDVAPMDRLLAISAGPAYACAVRADGSIVCWGNDPRGQVARFPLDTFKSVAAGNGFTCAIRSDDRLLCWGPIGASGLPSQPTAEAFSSVSAGREHACGIRTDGTLACWGLYTTPSLPGVPMPTEDGFVVGGSATFWSCGVRVDGSLSCWGPNAGGARTPPAGTFKDVSIEDFLGCAARTDGTMACWGTDDSERPPPAPPAFMTFDTVSVASEHGCGVRTDGKVACWGMNGSGQAPAAPSAATFKSVSAGESFTCGVRDDDRVVCWGDNGLGQAPPGPSLDRYLSVSAGASHACGVRTDGHLLCWGQSP